MDQRAEIEQVLDERVRPVLHRHNGNVEIVSFEDGVLSVRLLGMCTNCPSALATTEALVGGEVKAALSYVQSVMLVSGVSDGMLEMAREILLSRHKEV